MASDSFVFLGLARFLRQTDPHLARELVRTGGPGILNRCIAGTVRLLDIRRNDKTQRGCARVALQDGTGAAPSPAPAQPELVLS